MNILKIFQKKSRFFYFSIVLLSGISSIIYSSILIFINKSLVGQPITPFPRYDWLVFAALIVISFGCSRVFQGYMIKVSNDIRYEMEIGVVNKIRLASFGAFERLGPDKIFTAVSDARVLSRVPEAFINVINSGIILASGLGYLFWISPPGGLFVLLVMSSLLAMYVVRNKTITRNANVVRDLQDEYFGYLRELLLGFKELKTSIFRNSNLYHNYIVANRMRGKGLDIKTSRQYASNELTGTYSWYVIMGVIIFLLPNLSAFGTVQTSLFITVVLFLMSPIANLIMFMPLYTETKIALERIHRLEQTLDGEEVQGAPQADWPLVTGDFRKIVFEQVVYEYRRDENQTFVLGPLDLCIEKGEVLFITGGNGSGKSTFINLLTGLYMPQSGRILVDGRAVLPEQYPNLSNSFSSVFTNNYLFNENLDDFDVSENNPLLKVYTQMLQLEGKLRIDPRKNIIDNKLSKGQQKRLAMIHALLEDRPLLVLDEWAAEQDPGYRAYFYRHLVPELKRMGKTVIAVTHDDDYFNCADRVIKFNYGQVVSDETVENPALAVAAEPAAGR